MPNSLTIQRFDMTLMEMQAQTMQRKVLRTICPDAKGLIAKITNICYKHELNIVQNNEFVDHRTGRFFMRTELEGIFNDNTLLADLDSALPTGSVRELHSAGRRRVVILVTKEAHCLGDLLMKSAFGGLDMEIAAVIGNHETLRSLVERFDIPFVLVSHEGLTREEHDNRMADEIDRYQPDYVVLLAWHYGEAIAQQLRARGLRSRLVLPLPDVAVLEP